MKEKQFRLCEQVYSGGHIIPLYNSGQSVTYKYPINFTMSEAVDIFKDRPSILNRLKGLRPGTTLKLGKLSSSRCLVAVGDEVFDRDTLRDLEIELDSVNKEIYKLTNHLTSRQKELSDKIKEFKTGSYLLYKKHK